MNARIVKPIKILNFKRDKICEHCYSQIKARISPTKKLFRPKNKSGRIDRDAEFEDQKGRLPLEVRGDKSQSKDCTMPKKAVPPDVFLLIP